MDKHRSKACFLVIVLLITVTLYGFETDTAKPENAVKGYMDLSKWDFEKNGIVKLDGQWEFYWNKLLTPEDLERGDIKPDTYYTIPGAMDKMAVDGTPLSRFGHGTLRLRVKLPDGQTEWGLKSFWLLTSSSVWINGVPTAAQGQVGASKQEAFPLYVPTVSYFRNGSSESEIILQVSNYHDIGAQIGSLELGMKRQTQDKDLRKVFGNAFLIGSLLIMALYHFGLFAMRRKDRSVLYFGLFCLLVAVRVSLVGEALILRLYPRFPWELFGKTVLLTLYIGLPAFTLYMRELFPDEIAAKACKIVMALSALLAGMVLLTTSNIYDYTIVPFEIGVLMFLIYVAYALVRAVKKQRENAVVVLLGFLAIMGTAVNDILLNLGILHTTSLISTGLFLFTFSQSYILALRFSKAFTEAEALAAENKKMYTEIKFLNEDLEKKVEERTSALQESSMALRNLLDNAGQGFLYFNKDLQIEKEYSIECLHIFGMDIAGKSFPELLYPEDNENQSIIREVVQGMDTVSGSRREILLSLLPNEAVINGRYVHAGYKLIEYGNGETGFMVIFTDITEKRKLERQMEEERNTLRMVARVVAGHEDFLDTVKTYDYYCRVELPNLMESGKPPKHILSEIFRRIHTFKGIFGQFEMHNTVSCLHEFEGRMHHSCEAADDLMMSELKDLVKADELRNWTGKDLELLCKMLGEQVLLKEKVCIIPEQKIREIEEKASAMMQSEEADILLREIRKLRYRSLKEMLKVYQHYVITLSERLGKLVQDLSVTGEELLIDPDFYGGFIKTVVHVLRNALDHGIEEPLERAATGKNESGSVGCHIEKCSGYICLSITDDGRGIDFDRIRKKAAAMEAYDEIAAASLKEDDLLDRIFSEEFSTREEVSELSGRGYGLAAVKEELDRIGGRVEIITKSGEGTTFRFFLPYSP